MEAPRSRAFSALISYFAKEKTNLVGITRTMSRFSTLARKPTSGTDSILEGGLFALRYLEGKKKQQLGGTGHLWTAYIFFPQEYYIHSNNILPNNPEE